MRKKTAPLRYKSMDDIDEAMRRHAELQAMNEEREAAHTRLVEDDKSDMNEENAPRSLEQRQIERDMKAFLKPRRRHLISKYGKVMELKHGVVAFRVIPLHLIGPTGNAALVNFFLKRRGGKRYLEPNWQPKRDALAQTKSRLLKRQLAGLGYRIGRTERLSFKPNGYEKPIKLDDRPYNQPK